MSVTIYVVAMSFQLCHFFHLYLHPTFAFTCRFSVDSLYMFVILRKKNQFGIDEKLN